MYYFEVDYRSSAAINIIPMKEIQVPKPMSSSDRLSELSASLRDINTKMRQTKKEGLDIAIKTDEAYSARLRALRNELERAKKENVKLLSSGKEPDLQKVERLRATIRNIAIDRATTLEMLSGEYGEKTAAISKDGERIRNLIKEEREKEMTSEMGKEKDMPQENSMTPDNHEEEERLKAEMNKYINEKNFTKAFEAARALSALRRNDNNSQPADAEIGERERKHIVRPAKSDFER